MLGREKQQMSVADEMGLARRSICLRDKGMWRKEVSTRNI